MTTAFKTIVLGYFTSVSYLLTIFSGRFFLKSIRCFPEEYHCSKCCQKLQFNPCLKMNTWKAECTLFGAYQWLRIHRDFESGFCSKTVRLLSEHFNPVPAGLKPRDSYEILSSTFLFCSQIISYCTLSEDEGFKDEGTRFKTVWTLGLPSVSLSSFVYVPFDFHDSYVYFSLICLSLSP